MVARSLRSWAVCDPLCNTGTAIDIHCSPVFLTGQVIACLFLSDAKCFRVRLPGMQGADSQKQGESPGNNSGKSIDNKQVTF